MTPEFLAHVEHECDLALAEAQRTLSRRQFSIINHPIVWPGEIWIVAGQSCRGTLPEDNRSLAQPDVGRK